MGVAAIGPIIQGVGILSQVAGTAQSISSYNSAGNAALSAFQYNSKLIDLNKNRQLDQLATELRTFSSTQQADIARSGISVNSKSALQTMSDTLSSFEKEAMMVKENAKLERTRELAEFTAQKAQISAQKKAAFIQGLTGAAGGGASLFSSLSSTGGV